jgi:hypothetical protein
MEVEEALVLREGVIGGIYGWFVIGRTVAGLISG